jgi:hypothetical protein
MVRPFDRLMVLTVRLRSLSLGAKSKHKLTTSKLMHFFFLIMKHQGGLGGEVEEDIGIDAEE